MNLIFPLIAVLFVLCIITVHKLRKWILVTRQHSLQVSVTDKRNLSDHAEGQEKRRICQQIELNQSISIGCTVKGKSRKDQPPQAENAGDTNENMAHSLQISVNLLQ